MHNTEEQSTQNKEEMNKITVEALLNYECEEDDDGNDWET